MTTLVVATYNCPHRLAPHREMFDVLEEMGVDVILAQENTDKDNWAPPGWKKFRPRRAQSNTIYYNPRRIKRRFGGAKRLSSRGFRSLRYLVWSHFRFEGRPVRIASIHLPAFYTSNKRNRIEYDRQARKISRWIRRGRNRVIGGDFNGQTGSSRMAPIDKVARLSPPEPSGPSWQKIDYVGAKRGGRWRVVSAYTLNKGNSDHNPVVVSLQWVG